MPTKRYAKWRKVVVKRQRRLRKAIEELDDEQVAVAVGGPPKAESK